MVGLIVLVVADLATLMAIVPEQSGLHPFVALVAVWTGGLVAILLGLATYTAIRSLFRRLSR